LLPALKRSNPTQRYERNPLEISTVQKAAIVKSATMSLFGGLLGANPTATVTINGNASLEGYRDRVTDKKLPAYQRGDNISGKFEIAPPPGKSITHQGIVIAVYGDYQTKTGEKLGRFFERTQFLQPPGELTASFNSDFTFDRLEFPTCTFYGRELQVVYGVELKVVRRLKDFVQQNEFLLFFFDTAAKNPPIHNEIGMTGVLHIEFVFSHGSFDCQGVAIGVAYLLLVKLRIVHMQISLYCSESYENQGRVIKERTVVKSVEIMDGAPVRGDNIPIRFFLGDCNLWPYVPFKDSAIKVEWYLRAQMTDENGKKYYKSLKAQFVRHPPTAEATE
jgi:vacuolar protein sorting-associated protein 26